MSSYFFHPTSFPNSPLLLLRSCYSFEFIFEFLFPGPLGCPLFRMHIMFCYLWYFQLVISSQLISIMSFFNPNFFPFRKKFPTKFSRDLKSQFHLELFSKSDFSFLKKSVSQEKNLYYVHNFVIYYTGIIYQIIEPYISSSFIGFTLINNINISSLKISSNII